MTDKKLRAYRKKYRILTGSFIYPRDNYTTEQDKMILAHLISDVELSKIIKHSVTGIQKHRCLLKKSMRESLLNADL